MSSVASVRTAIVTSAFIWSGSRMPFWLIRRSITVTRAGVSRLVIISIVIEKNQQYLVSLDSLTSLSFLSCLLYNKMVILSIDYRMRLFGRSIRRMVTTHRIISKINRIQRTCFHHYFCYDYLSLKVMVFCVFLFLCVLVDLMQCININNTLIRFACAAARWAPSFSISRHLYNIKL